ncbi:putative DNA damage-inducible protein 1 [Blattamonas nauphoetae]|uniref:DNA damage-inducible protein 1 n=1 Tax=Blattamonas nauphoetae TaxID=2049346 RepID=A0ABQ9XXK8_9EUKA|nr:putative DNA damage-inducible protein 1 [Blattamonas nauphoetae]
MEPETYIAYIRSDPVASNLLQQSRPDIYQAVQIGDTDVVDLYLMEVYNHKMKVYHKLQQRQRMIDANPNSVEAQTAIMANIHRIAIKENFEKAMEEIPESFVSVHMLYIPVEINGRPVQVFVDSGAQITVISRTLCDHCGIGHLIDKSVKGRAVGVGTAESVGRIHAVPLKIGTKLYTTSFMVLEGGPVDCLLGLDMLRRHRCVIDLDQNVIRIGGESLPFLTEQQTKTSMLDEKTPLGYTPDPPVAQKKSAPINLIPQLTYSEQNLQSLLDMGVDRDRAIQALTAANDNLDAAIDLI